MPPQELLHIVVAGHTNAGKTSLLRTLTRQRDFGAVSENPGTTRATQAATLRVDGHAAVRFLDTPGLGAVADVAMAGLSLGAATAVGAGVGGAASGGWRPLWDKFGNRLRGQRELSAEDATLQLLAQRLCALALALAARGHAAQQRLRLADGAAQPSDTARALRPLTDARAHPEWERGAHRFKEDAARAALRDTIAHALDGVLQTAGDAQAPPAIGSAV